MRPFDRRRPLDRPPCFETLEPKIYLSGTSAADYHVDHFDAQSSQESVFTSAVSTFDLDGPDSVRTEFGLTGAGQTVVIIDSGIAYDHRALGGGLGAGYQVVGGYDFTAERDADPYDDGPVGSHGTHVAGIIASNDSSHPGIAPGVDLVGLRVFDDAGQGKLEWIKEALQWVHVHRNDFENPITTVNLSLGAEWNSGHTGARVSFDAELARLKADGIFVSVAAGNSFTKQQQAGLTYPATSQYVVPVASVDPNGSLSYFSQRDDRVIAAPGRSILSTVPDYVGNQNGIDDDFGRYSGTSMAAPYVAGAAVLLREAYQTAGVANVSPTMIHNLMISTADDVYDPITRQSYHRLNLERAVEAVLPDGKPGFAARDVEWGTVRQSSFDDNRIDATGQWFSMTAGTTGVLTTEAIFSNANGNVQLEIFNANRQLLHSRLGNQNGHRIDVTARAGETFYLRAYTTAGVNADVDFRVTNLLRQQGRAIHVLGTAGDDHFVFRSAAAHYLAINDVLYQFDTTAVNQIRFDGLGGSDTAVLFGTDGNDTATIRPRATLLRTPGYAVQTSRVEDTLVRAGAGFDRAWFHDSAGADAFAATPDAAAMQGPGFHNRALSFERVEASATGGYDIARLYDSPANDAFVATALGGRLSGAGFDNRAWRFESICAYANAGGIDVAKLFDSDANDTLVATPGIATLSGKGLVRQVRAFDGVHAYATAGGHDVAKLFDSAGNDMLVVSQEAGALFGAGFYNRAKFFEEVHANGKSGGNDRAKLQDSSVDDYFRASGNRAQLSSNHFVTWLHGFEYVRATASQGGSDHTEIAAVDYLLELGGQWD